MLCYRVSVRVRVSVNPNPNPKTAFIEKQIDYKPATGTSLYQSFVGSFANGRMVI